MDYLYGKLNKEVEQNSYKGSISDTIKINIDDSTNVISGELDINNIRYSFELGEIASKAKLQHGLVAADNSQFLAFSIETGRLVMVNSVDLSFTFIGPKTYDMDRTKIGLYKLALDTVFILYLDILIYIYTSYIFFNI